MSKFAIVISIFLAFSCCKTKQGAVKNNEVPESIDYSGQPTIVYKTKADFYKNVPVTLSEDKSRIVSYAGLTDIYYKGSFSLPTALSKGYLLDNRGINENSAFLKYSYEEYSQLKEVPSITELFNQIVEKDPFLEIYNLGNRSRFENEVTEINAIIEKGDLKKFKKVK